MAYPEAEEAISSLESAGAGDQEGAASLERGDSGGELPVSSVETGESSFGILICGSANGVAITANKHAGIRAAICWQNEIAAITRQHNNANIVCIPARFVSLFNAISIVDTFLNTSFEGARHANRIAKIACA